MHCSSECVVCVYRSRECLLSELRQGRLPWKNIADCCGEIAEVIRLDARSFAPARGNSSERPFFLFLAAVAVAAAVPLPLLLRPLLLLPLQLLILLSMLLRRAA